VILRIHRLPIAASILLAGCIHVNLPAPPPAAGPDASAATSATPATVTTPAETSPAGDAEAEPRFKKWAEVLKDTRAVAGLFTVHMKRDRAVLLELAPSQLGRDYGLGLRFSRGAGDFEAVQGMPLGDVQLVRFDRVGDRIHLVRRNPLFTAAPGSNEARALERNLGHSVVASFAIESEHADSRHLLIDATSFLVSDYAEAGAYMEVYFGGSAPSLESDRSWTDTVQAFPRNIEFDVSLTYRGAKAPGIGGAGVSDYRAIPVGIRYSLMALPDEPMRPRLADQRVGHFVAAVYDYSRLREPSPFREYVTRWRLQKADPQATSSEPVQPIVFYIDRGVPAEYRPFVREGIEAWNRAFDAAGFRRAVVARDAPDDPDWSPDDMRWSVVRWTPAYNMYYAIAPFQSDPRTGEILKGDVLISSTFLAGWQAEFDRIAAPNARFERFRELQRLHRELPADRARHLCFAQFGANHQLSVQHAFLSAIGSLEPGAELGAEYIGDALRDLVMHEIGHALGLRHNFKASSGIPYDRLHDTAFTSQHGVSLSVMDYSPVNISPDPRRQGHYWNRNVGTYDVWAIRYAYEDLYRESPASAGRILAPGTRMVVDTTEAELPALRALAARAAEPMHAYATDEDNWIGPWALDPHVNAWDLGSDPLRYAADRAAIIARVTPELERRIVADGQGYSRLSSAFTALLHERLMAVLPATRMIGGMYTSRSHRGDAGAPPPFRPVPAAEQRQAVRFIIEHAFEDDVWRFEPALLNRLAPDRAMHWGTPGFTIPLDYPLHAVVGLVQSILLEELLDAVRIARLLDAPLRVERPADAFTAAELFATVTDAIWREVPARGRASNVSSLRRNLQRAHAGHLGQSLLLGSTIGGSSIYEDARAHARAQLVGIRARIAGALSDGDHLDTDSRVHLDDMAMRIDRILDAALALPAR
jgi:hypothetical protein